MACGLIPSYITEISPFNLRGAANVIPQLFLTMGILVSQILGFRQILGQQHLWHFLLALSAVPCLIGGLLYLLFLPESPSYALTRKNDEKGAYETLKKLRNRSNVSDEIDKIKAENREASSCNAISISELFTTKRLRWPLIIGIAVQLTQQLSGINAVRLLQFLNERFIFF